MPIPFAINGLGRIGRALVRIAHQRPELELVAVNDLAPAHVLASLVARDSVHGRFAGTVVAKDGALEIDGRRVEVFEVDEPSAIPWSKTSARLVVEASGGFTRRDAAAGHLHDSHGPRKVLVAAIVEDADAVLCPGLDTHFDPQTHDVVSLASCTSHCLALLVDVLDRELGVRHALMNEVHAYTGNQRLLDGVYSVDTDPRRARAAALNIVPTFTAAPRAVERLMPHLAGRLGGIAIRVPTPDVALLELTATVERPASGQEVQDMFRQAASGRHRGVLAVSEEPLVSSDFVGDPHSAIVDLELIACAGDMCRILAWYDNEWGYAHRLADFVTTLGETLT